MGFFSSLDRSFRGKSGAGFQRTFQKIISAPIRSVAAADPLYSKARYGKFGSANQHAAAGVHELYSSDPVAKRSGISEKNTVKIAKAAGAAAAIYFTGGALASYYGAAGAAGGTAASDAGTLYASGEAAGGYAGAVFPSAASSGTALASSGASTVSASSLLSTLGGAVKTTAGVITSVKVIADAVGRRRVLPAGADVPPGYEIIGDYPANGNINGPLVNGDLQTDSVSSDGVGFALPANSGFLLLALVALAFVKG